MLKFRTMHHAPVIPGSCPQATRHDPRVTRVGAWLRHTSFDELPQLLNVLMGSMSLVGPAPARPRHLCRRPPVRGGQPSLRRPATASNPA